jgi:hypothetical protein
VKDRIRKILRESDFDWANDSSVDVPLDEISGWAYETRYKVAPFIQKIDEFYKQAPQVNWNDRDDMNDEDKMIALSVRAIGDELKNIYSSLESIEDEIHYISNPSMFDDEDDD